MVTSRSSMVLLCAAPVCAAVGSWGSSASASIPVTPALAVCGSWDWASARASWTPDTQIEVTAVWVTRWTSPATFLGRFEKNLRALGLFP